MPNKIIKLLKDTSPFWISNAVKDGISDLSIGNGAGDRVCCYFLVLYIAPCLSHKEHGHCVRRWERKIRINERKAEIGGEVSKGLIKPKIIPPLHGDKISEPHVRQFMRYCASTFGSFIWGGGSVVYVNVCKCNWARILHSAHGKFWTENKINFSKGVFIFKEFFVKLYSSFAISENVFFLVLKFFWFCLWAENPHRNVKWAIRIVVFDNCVCACDNSEEVCWEEGSLFKMTYYLSILFIIKGLRVLF